MRTFLRHFVMCNGQCDSEPRHFGAGRVNVKPAEVLRRISQSGTCVDLPQIVGYDIGPVSPPRDILRMMSTLA